MIRIMWQCVVVSLILVAASVTTHTQNGERVVPVFQEPRHRLVFDAGTTKILNPQIYPGDVSLWHTHAEPLFTVTFGSSEIRTQDAGEAWTPPALPFPRAGLILSSPEYATRPVTHRVENVGKNLFELVVVSNATAGDATQSAEAAGFDGAPEVSDNWFRAYRLTLGPGQTAKHVHAAPVVIVQLDTGRGVATGQRTFGLNGPASWAYFDANDPHELSNRGRDAINAIEIEVRQPRR